MSKRTVGNWTQKRVAVAICDSRLDLKIVNTTMPVRMKHDRREDGTTIYEGPAKAVGERVLKDYPGYDAVGVLIAEQIVTERGFISWIEDTAVVDTHQVGEDQIREARDA